MRPGRWLAAGLILLGAVVAATALLGPFVTDVIHYRTSDTTLNQIVGGDAAALVIVAPFTVAVGVLALRGHPAAPVLAVAPAGYVLYTYAQLIVGQEYLRLPGNNERFFPLLLAGFLLAGSVAVGSWRAVDAEHLPRTPRWLDRLAAGVLLSVAVYLVFGLHLRSLVDAMRDTPSRVEYVSSPTPFWLVKLMDLGIVVPIAVAAAVGVLRGTARARRPMYAIVGAYTMLAASVAGMAITMLAHGDPDSSVPTVIVFVCFAAAFTALAVVLYRPLFARQAGAPQPATTLRAKEKIR
jgi:hypothetical protein